MMHLTKQFEHLKIRLEAIICATNNFADNHCIGRGGFGKVYKGELLHSKGESIVALKRLDPTFGQGNPEFWKEIIMLSLYKHENIVSLLGFCDEGNEKILVYEYASKRSLDLYLSDNGLNWIDRLKICIGVARGLAYLHNPGGTQQRALHRDIKSSNVLLDENWNAKISDMGLSKLGPANQQYTFLVSNTVGTIGYCDPLYVETGLLTKESDVYSFGVVLFEVLCGRLCTNNKQGMHRSLTGLVRRYYKENKINEIIFHNIKDEIRPKSLEVFTTIAYRCLKRDLELRPLMGDVVSILESALEYQIVESHTSMLKSNQLSKEMERLYLNSYNNSLLMNNNNGCGSSTSKGYEEDVEVEVNSYFQQLFSRRLTIDAMIQMLAQYKESPKEREQSIYKYVIANLFEEYKFFSNYPERQLKIVANLFGLLIKNQLLSHLNLGMALRAVLNALRKPPDSKMFAFGTKALEKFLDRMAEWPQYCNHILQISHLRSTRLEIVNFIEEELARTSSGHMELDVDFDAIKFELKAGHESQSL